MRELEGRSYAEIGQILDLSVSAIETLIFRARRALREQLEGGLTCGEAEAVLSKRLDGRLAVVDQGALRAHLRECPECASLERKQRAQRAAMMRLSVVQLPPSLASFFGGASSITGGAIASGLVVKAAAMVAAGVVAGGIGHQAVEALAASEPPRSQLPELQRLPRSYPATFGTSSTAFSSQVETAADASAPAGRGTTESRLRQAIRSAVGRSRPGTPPSDGGAPPTDAGAVKASPAPTIPGATPTSALPKPVRTAAERAGEIVTTVAPKPPVEVPPVTVPQLPPLPPLTPIPPLPPPPPLP